MGKLEERIAYKGIPNSWFNDKDELVFADKRNVLMGSARYSNVFLCSKCFREYYLPWMAKRHAKQCKAEFADIIYRKDNLSIAHMTINSNPVERLIAERISRIGSFNNSYDHAILRNNNWTTGRVDQEAFLLLEDSSIIAYLVLQNHKLTEKQVIGHMFTIEAKRRKNHFRTLLLESLKYLSWNFETLAASMPVSNNGEEALRKIAISLGFPGDSVDF
jgi:hypothetical protein